MLKFILALFEVINLILSVSDFFNRERRSNPTFRATLFFVVIGQDS